MTTPPLPLNADSVLQLSTFDSAAELRSLQTRLTGTTREVRQLTTGGRNLPGKLGAYLTQDQKRLLLDAAQLLDTVNTHIEHAKEKRQRHEKDTKRRQDARNAQARQLIASRFPLPFETLEDKLEILRIALTFNRARVFDILYSPTEFNQSLRERLSQKHPLTGKNSPAAYYANRVSSTRDDLLQQLIDEIAYDDGSEVEERLNALGRRGIDGTTQIPLTLEEQETLRLWRGALSPSTALSSAGDTAEKEARP
ncbi:hypothetical protein C5U62_32215 [Pseudomonas protegens]|uniref:Uncharacterized protein n=1 Tax=Pseudomonas protegens TaxID=380021 RepID=A0A2T6GB54_9PSED|nr:hypothetical protein [Pseudomonas protegens]PUA41390.1 hypothetical protein C5U62_32215 [Pseudomonas protegens]